jgi:hypothetical protein
MPGVDGTGPMGRGPMTGRGFGRCRFGQVRRDITIPPEQAQDAGVQEEPQPGQPAGEAGARVPVNGVGCGGIPRGCGRGRCFGGGRGARWRGKPGEGA